MDLLTVVLFIAGLVLLIAGAELLVRGSAALAAAVGISPLVIGLTVVAFGTSAPELAVSVKAAWSGQSDITIGNVVGSNIFNTLFILGLSAIVAPLAVSRQVIRHDAPILVGVCLLMVIMSLDGRIGRYDGLALLLLFVGYTVHSIRSSRRQNAAGADVAAATAAADANAPIAVPVNNHSLLAHLLLVVGGLALLGVGTNFLVDGAVKLARSLGISELVIGLTIIAAGTSLPEVAASVMATVRGHRDIAIGNVVGSNMYNILAILGAASAISPVRVLPDALNFDIPVMVGAALLCLPIFYSGRRISRWEGIVLLGYYILYTLYVILVARSYEGAASIGHFLLWYVLPATAVPILIAAAWQYFRPRPDAATA